MAVSTQFISCTGGTWTQLCEYRETRVSLMIQLIGGFCVISPTTNTPTVTNTYGTMPAGFFHSTEFGMGPNVFEVYKAAEDDCVRQIWYVWVPLQGSPEEPTLIYEQSWTDPIFSVAMLGDDDPTLAIMWTASASTGVVPITAVSDLLGALTPVHTSTVVDGLGDQQRVDVYVWSSPGGETITLTIGANAVGAAQLFRSFGTGIGSTGSNTLTGMTIRGLTSSPPSSTWCVMFMVVQGVGMTATPTASENVRLDEPFSRAQVSPDGTTWWVGGTIGLAKTAGAEGLVLITTTGVIDPASTYIAAMLPPPDNGDPAIITVTEAYGVPALDDPNWVDPSKQIRVRMPRLSRKGVRALQDLLKQSRLAKSDPDAAGEA